ncbi:WD-40 repeat-containing protein [Crepidotus variabilis]|uniref:methylated diphthine methylhydrolase n=1 Tax=Crepidotus variabilis TaxID=179855 RepID=A0A9P6ECC9_9AGAR|nr:WD-40 repeat-containing protein [Crepidotus variabilis]
MSSLFNTIFPADSLEFCPTPGFQDLFACGTYKLLDQDQDQKSSVQKQEKSLQKRRGQCLLFRARPTESVLEIEQIQSVDLPAIPDMKWCPSVSRDMSPSISSDPLLAVADSEGSITLHSCDKGSLSQMEAVRCASPEILCLSLDWSNRRFAGSNLGSLVVSLSNGSLSLISPTQGSMEIQETWHAHDYEPWIAAWDYWDSNVIYSGGDDLKLKSWDLRQGFDQPLFTNKRFEAGVTTIQNHPHIEHLVVVGSYDNTIRLFDTRKMVTPLVSTDVGGGVWRAKWHPSPARKNDLLLACMHDGFKTIHFSSSTPADSPTTLEKNTQFSESEGHIVKHYTAHESLAYGADWSHAPALGNRQTIVGCCSFYDHKMSLFLA